MRLLFALLLAISLPAFAQHDHSAHVATAQPAPLTDGQVKKIDKAASAIVIQHGQLVDPLSVASAEDYKDVIGRSCCRRPGRPKVWTYRTEHRSGPAPSLILQEIVMNIRQLVTPLIVTASLAFALSAAAASDKPAEPAADKPAAAAATPHNHMTEKTGMSAAKAPAQKTTKKPLHDHRKEHKQ